jgi:hypothetical protein
VRGVCRVLRRRVRGRAAVAAGRVCAVFTFFSSVPCRGEMELPALTPPAPQPRVRIDPCSLSSDSGARAVHRLAPPPARAQLRLALAVEPLSLLAPHSPCTPAPASSPYCAAEAEADGERYCFEHA